MNILGDLLLTIIQYLPLVGGSYIAILILRFPDLTIEASWSVGGIFACWGAVQFGGPMWLYPLAGFIFGGLCGLLTAWIFRLTGRMKLLSGFITYMVLEALGFHLLGDKATLFVQNGALTKFAFGKTPDAAVFIYSFYSVAVLVLVTWWQRSRAGIRARVLGEKPESYHFFGFRLDREYLIGLLLCNAFVGLGGGLMALYQGQANNVAGIGLVLKAFFALLVGDEILKMFTASKRTEPWAIMVGVFVFAALTQLSDYGQILESRHFDWDWLKPTDKQLVLAAALLGVLWYRRRGFQGKKEVSQW